MMETTWAKLADYYELTEDSPVYSAATVLNPSLKWAYMEKTWDDKNEWIERAKARAGSSGGGIQIYHSLPCSSTSFRTRAKCKTTKWVQNVDERAKGYDFQHG
ncbi:hypothetical protein HRG_006696 [Hirsutella rhossiliensis]